MKLSRLRGLLEEHAHKPFHLVLPGAAMVPVSFHITEVGHVTKKFLDCGGRLRAVQSCQLQAWLGQDADHRLPAGKMAGALRQAKAKGVLPEGVDLDVEIEYEDAARSQPISQYTVASFAVTENAVILNLAAKHTDCLAKDACLPRLPMAGMAPSSCGCGPGCC